MSEHIDESWSCELVLTAVVYMFVEEIRLGQ